MLFAGAATGLVKFGQSPGDGSDRAPPGHRKCTVLKSHRGIPEHAVGRLWLNARVCRPCLVLGRTARPGLPPTRTSDKAQRITGQGAELSLHVLSALCGSAGFPSAPALPARRQERHQCPPSAQRPSVHKTPPADTVLSGRRCFCDIRLSLRVHVSSTRAVDVDWRKVGGLVHERTCRSCHAMYRAYSNQCPISLSLSASLVR